MTADTIVGRGGERKQRAVAGAARRRRMQPARVVGRVEVDGHAPVVPSATALDGAPMLM